MGSGGSFCVASASFSGNVIDIELELDRGKPGRGSVVYYHPAHPEGAPSEVEIAATYALNANISVTAPSSLEATYVVSPRDAKGSFVLTVGGQEFRSRPDKVLTGYPGYHGKAEVHQVFDMKRPLLDALAAGGPGRLAYLDDKGATLAQVDLTFAPTSVIQGAVEKTYPTALAFTQHKGQC
jgi:hypothetical protein